MKKNIYERNVGIDLLRILLMFMIVILHVVGYGGIIENVEINSLNYYLIWLLEIICFVCVDCYAIISGYVGIDSKYKFSNIIILWLKVFLYSILLYLFVAGVLEKNFDFITLIKNFFPVIMGNYWYFTSYFILFLFMPFINNFYDKISKRQLNFVMLLLFLFMSIIPTLQARDIFCTVNGYSSFWLIYLYLIGAFLKKNHLLSNKKINTNLLVFIYLFSVFITFALKILFDKRILLPSLILKDGGAFVNYTSPTVIISSICLILLFTSIKFKNNFFKKTIQIISPLTFSVYLISDNYYIRTYFINNKFIYASNFSPAKIVLFVLSLSFLIFCICITIDYIREYLFKKMKIHDKLKKIDCIILEEAK